MCVASWKSDRFYQVVLSSGHTGIMLFIFVKAYFYCVIHSYTSIPAWSCFDIMLYLYHVVRCYRNIPVGRFFFHFHGNIRKLNCTLLSWKYPRLLFIYIRTFPHDINDIPVRIDAIFFGGESVVDAAETFDARQFSRRNQFGARSTFELQTRTQISGAKMKKSFLDAPLYRS